MSPDDALRAELRRVREMLEAVPALVVRTNADLVIVEVGRAGSDWSRDTALGRSIFDIIPPPLVGVARRTVAAALDSGTSQRVLTQNDDVTWEVTVRLLPGGDLLYIARDASREEAQAERLAHTQESLDIARVAGGVGLWSLDSRTGVVTWDDAMFEMTGVSAPLSMAQWLDYVPEGERAAVAAAQSAGPDASGRVAGATHRFVRPDGEVRWLSTTAHVRVRPDGSSSLLGCSVDVTQQRLYEERLREAQRLEAVGQLAAGVAHNFNNLLAVILPALDELRLRADVDLKPSADDAREAALRAVELVRRLMTFAQRRPADRADTELARVVAQRAVQLCERIFGDLRIELRVDEAASDSHVCANLAELEQVLVNLLLNARDAVHEARRETPHVSVEVSVVPAEASRPLPTPAADGHRLLRLRIEDNGAGMTPEVLRRLFEPFFTTKEPGRGTGLGAPTARVSVRRAGGDIECTSTPGVGTRVDVYLPEAPPANTSGPDAEAVRGAGREVLVIDDDAMVRRSVRRVLEASGFVAFEAASVREGCDAARAHPTVEVVLLDCTMPGGSGAPAVVQLRALLPGARVLIFTGGEVEDGVAGAADGVVHKPATIDALLAAVARPLPG